MRHNSPLFLGFKLLILSAPLAVAVILYLPHAQTPAMLQASVIDAKIQRLVLSGERPQAIIAGESRAFYNVVPAVFTQKTHLYAVNVAVGGETMAQVYDSLNQSDVLNQHRLILISVSSDQINDSFSDNLPLSRDVIAAEPFGGKKIQDWYTYESLVFSTMFVNFRSFLHDGIDSALHTGLHVDDATFTNLGYTPNTGVFDPTQGVQAVLDSSYTSVVTGGTREREFVRGIDGFGHTNDTVVIYLSPFAPSWIQELASSTAPEVEAHFAEVIRTAITPYPQMHFVDLQTTAVPGLDDTKFADGVHLNASGAPIFTAYLADTLRRQGIIK